MNTTASRAARDLADEYTRPGAVLGACYHDEIAEYIDAAMPVCTSDIIREWSALDRIDPEEYDGDGGIVERMTWAIYEESRENFDGEIYDMMRDAAEHLAGVIRELSAIENAGDDTWADTRAVILDDLNGDEWPDCEAAHTALVAARDFIDGSIQ